VRNLFLCARFGEHGSRVFDLFAETAFAHGIKRRFVKLEDDEVECFLQSSAYRRGA
jgi:hypothetical protein